MSKVLISAFRKFTAPYEGDNKVKAVVHLNENAGKGNKAQLINKNRSCRCYN